MKPSHHQRHMALKLSVFLLLFGASALITTSLVGGGGSSPSKSPVPVSAVTSLGAHSALFADDVTARLDVVIDSAKAGHVTTTVNFKPFKIIGRWKKTTDLGHGRTLVHYEFSLRCLRTACVPQQGLLPLRFQPAIIHYGTHKELRQSWPALVLLTRLATAGSSSPNLLDDQAYTVGISHSKSPLALFALLLVAIALGLALSAFLVWLGFAPEKPLLVEAEESEPQATREPALALARRHLVDDVWNKQRSALEDLARELDEEGQPEFASRARSFAWSEQHPDPVALRDFFAEIEQASAAAEALGDPAPAAVAEESQVEA